MKKELEVIKDNIIMDLYNMDFKYVPLNSEINGDMNWDIIIINLVNIIKRRFGMIE